MRPLLLVPVLLLTGGCVSTAKTIVTAPFKVAGAAVDAVTTSQSEADEKRGKRIRKAEEQARKDCRREVEGDYARELCVRDRMRERGY